MSGEGDRKLLPLLPKKARKSRWQERRILEAIEKKMKGLKGYHRREVEDAGEAEVTNDGLGRQQLLDGSGGRLLLLAGGKTRECLGIHDIFRMGCCNGQLYQSELRPNC